MPAGLNRIPPSDLVWEIETPAREEHYYIFQSSESIPLAKSLAKDLLEAEIRGTGVRRVARDYPKEIESTYKRLEASAEAHAQKLIIRLSLIHI